MNTQVSKSRTPKRIKQSTPAVTPDAIAAQSALGTAAAPKYGAPAEIDISNVAGPALQQAITELNQALIKTLFVAARLGNSEPLAPELLGVSRELLDELATLGRADMLSAQCHGLPLAIMRISDAATMRYVIDSGVGSPDALAAITKSLPLELVERATRKKGRS